MTGFVDTLLARFDEKLAEHVKSALTSPQGREAFDFGRACGVYQGLNLAREIVLDTISEAEEHDDKL